MDVYGSLAKKHNKIAVISANAEVLAGEIGDNEWLSYIQSEIQRTNHLVENLLTLARMDR